MALGGGTSAGSVHVTLGARLDRSDFEAYDRELRKVQEKVARRDQFKAQLGANYDNRAFNAYDRQLTQSTKHTEENIRATGRLRTAFGTLYSHGGEMAAAAGVTFGLAAGIKSITEAYQKDQVAQA